MKRSNGAAAGRLGFTMIEMIIALLLGVIILSAAITFLITHLRMLEGSDIRENVERNGRYIGVLLRRDIQAAGIDIESTTNFGTVAVWPGAPNDTLMLISTSTSSEFDTRGMLTPLGTTGVIYLVHEDDPDALAAVTLSGGGAFRYWRFRNGQWVK